MKLNKYIDHTLLKSTAREEDIRKLCAEAREYDFASVCINPCYVPLAKGALKEGRDAYVRDEIAQIVRAAKGRCVKVIIETGLLTDEEKVRAVKLACEAGATFVKTCTGFTEGKATVHDVQLMASHVTGGVKVKASGGIKTYEDAMALIEAGASRLGASSGVAIMAGETK